MNKVVGLAKGSGSENKVIGGHQIGLEGKTARLDEELNVSMEGTEGMKDHYWASGLRNSWCYLLG